MNYKSPVVILGLMALPAVSSGAVSATHSFTIQALGTPFAISSTDLINTGQSTLSSTTSNYVPFNVNYGQVGVLTDGIATGNDSFRTLPDNRMGYTVTYFLNTTVNALGYNITGINTYGGNTDSRARQEYQVLYRLVGTSDFVRIVPENFTTDRAATQPFQTNNSTTPGDLAGGSGGESELRIVISGLSGVDAIQFITQFPSGNSSTTGASVYREFDVIGSAVPEPTTALLSALGLFGILRRKR